MVTSYIDGIIIEKYGINGDGTLLQVAFLQSSKFAHGGVGRRLLHLHSAVSGRGMLDFKMDLKIGF